MYEVYERFSTKKGDRHRLVKRHRNYTTARKTAKKLARWVIRNTDTGKRTASLGETIYAEDTVKEKNLSRKK